MQVPECRGFTFFTVFTDFAAFTYFPTGKRKRRFFMPYAISVKTMSPSIWPFVSLICLKLSVSIMKKAQIFSGFSSRYALICFSVSFLLYKPVSASRSARILRSSIACFLSSILKIMHRAFTGFSCRPHMATPWT